MLSKVEKSCKGTVMDAISGCHPACITHVSDQDNLEMTKQNIKDTRNFTGKLPPVDIYGTMILTLSVFVYSSQCQLLKGQKHPSIQSILYFFHRV